MPHMAFFAKISNVKWRIEMEKKNDKLMIIIAGLVIGVIAAGLAFLGNPKNM